VLVVRRLNGEFRDQLTMTVTDYTALTFSADRPPQSDIREADQCDLVIGILWSRIGTPLDPTRYCRPDGHSYESGTVYEIETSLKASRQTNGQPRVVLFRKTAPSDFASTDDPAELRKLREQANAADKIIKKWTVSPDGYLYGAVNEFSTIDEFETKLETGIRQWLADKGHKPRIVWNITDGPPFPGLRSYTSEYAKVFFGRDEDIRLCRQALVAAAQRSCAFLVIIGASGSGKSSLALAGLSQRVAIPVAGVNSWLVERFTPGNSPLDALGRALAHAIASRTASFEADAKEWAAHLRDDPSAACSKVAEKVGTRRRLLLIADQLEEAFDVPAEGFTTALAVLARSGAVWVVATLRVDRYADFYADHTLLQLKTDGAHYDLVPPDFNAIVRGPVMAAGLEFERRKDGTDLGTVLVRSAGGRDALPLLQMALRELYEARSDNVLTFDTFDNKLGGLTGAISRYADTVLNRLDEAARQNLQPLLMGLTRIGPDGDYYSCPLSQAKFETTSARTALAKTLLDGRLLVGDRDELRVSHEALLRNWQAAQDVLRGHERLLRVRDRLEHRAQQWSDSQQASDELLAPGQLLFDAEAALDDLRETDAELLVQFVEASIENRDVKTVALKARLAADEQKITDHVFDGEFAQAKDVLTRVVDYLADTIDSDLIGSRIKFEQQLMRVRRLADFSTAAAQAMTLAGEERFESALDVCEASLKALGFGEDPEWWRNLPVEDLPEPQAELLRRTAYRALLLLGALRLVPGIVDLFGKPTPGPPRRRSGAAVQKLAGLLPRRMLLRAIAAGRIGPYRLPLPTRMDKPAAVAEFQKCLDALAWVARVEGDDAKAHGTQKRASRTSCFVQGVVEVLQAFATGPDGAPINYSEWLGLSGPIVRPEPVNAADYFFMGLLNFYVAKRRDTALLAKVIGLFQPQFPDVDPRTPLDTADRLIRSGVALEPQHYWPHWVLGRVLSEKGDYGGAELAFNAAIAVDKGYSRGYEQRALVLGALWAARHEPGLMTRAEEDSATAMALANGDPSIFWPRGELLQRFGDKTGALDAYCRWLELEHDLLGKVSRGGGVTMLDALATRLARASDLGVSAVAHALQAWVHLTRGESRPALDRAEASLLIDPKQPHALTAKGIVLWERQEPREALAFLDRACEQDPLNYRAALHRAELNEQLGFDEQARLAWNKLEEMSAEAADLGREKCPDWILKQANRRGPAGPYPP
jgi:tetratricopeptide (TPR) repeat protein